MYLKLVVSYMRKLVIKKNSMKSNILLLLQDEN